MIIIEGYVRLRDAADFEALKPAAAAQIAASRAEEGCVEYAYAIDLLDPHIMRVSEKWESWAALEAHFKADHMTVWRAALTDVSFAERHLTAYEATSWKSL